ncbi:MAG: glutamate formimidoyltransferase [Vicinamibacterales bacterium]|nr:glutamate formimidoyltransferase [Vicinamibacterales bacterium]
MSQIISVVPNVCEGRDQAFIESLQGKLERVPGLVVLDVSMDQVRNRTNFSFTGRKEAIFEGGFLLYEAALGHIDMRQHQGEYPRVGAVDVFPFVALRDVPIATAVEWSIQFAEAVGERFQFPVYLFAESARTKVRRDIENIREGEYEGFAAKIADPAWKPDFGPDVFQPDKGATIIGARLPIVNFKAYLTTPNEEAAEWVAEVLSSPTTGMPGVHFYPALDRTRNEALLNITVGNFQATPLYRILEAVKTELRRFGAGVSRVEMVGLVPQRALLESAQHYLQIFGFSLDDVVENRLDSILGGRG